MNGHFLAGLAGYDTALVARLEPLHAAWFSLIGAGCLVGSLLVGGACGYGALLLFASRALAGAAFVLGGLFFLNVLRLANAGGGAAAASRPFESWQLRPWWPLAVWLAGLVLAQPIVTYVLRDRVDAVIAGNRYAIIAVHRETVLGEFERRIQSAIAQRESIEQAITRLKRSGAPAVPREIEALQRNRAEAEIQLDRAVAARDRALKVELPAYEAHIGRSGFLANRFRATWTQPERALLLTLVFSVLIASGAILRWPARAAMYAYQRLRWELDRAIVDAAYRANLKRRKRVLGLRPGFRGIRTYYEDPPYNTVFLPFGRAATTLSWEKALQRVDQSNRSGGPASGGSGADD